MIEKKVIELHITRVDSKNKNYQKKTKRNDENIKKWHVIEFSEQLMISNEECDAN